MPGSRELAAAAASRPKRARVQRRRWRALVQAKRASSCPRETREVIGACSVSVRCAQNRCSRHSGRGLVARHEFDAIAAAERLQSVPPPSRPGRRRVARGVDLLNEPEGRDACRAEPLTLLGATPVPVDLGVPPGRGSATTTTESCASGSQCATLPGGSGIRMRWRAPNAGSWPRSPPRVIGVRTNPSGRSSPLRSPVPAWLLPDGRRQ